jgi:hypothetical protein
LALKGIICDVEISLTEIYNEEYKDLIEERRFAKKEELKFTPVEN